jgi:hypothetical protein
MSLRIRWPFTVMLLAVALLAGAATAAYYTKFFQLKSVTVVPEAYAGQADNFNLALGQNLLLAPVENAVNYLLTMQSVTRVQVDYDLPNGLTIRVNDVKPVALALGEDKRSIYGIDDRCRMIPYEQSGDHIDLPLITGLKRCPFYQKPAYPHLGLIIRQLQMIKTDDPDFYHILSTVDLSDGDSITVFMDGIPFHMIMQAGGLYRGVTGLRNFVLDCGRDLPEITRLDFRTEGQIIATKKKCQKKES